MKLLQSWLGKRGFLLKRKNKWTDLPLSVLPAIVDSYCDGLERTCTVVQIGANDGESNDHVQWCIKYLDVRALLVEPMPAPFQILESRYSKAPNVSLDNCAVSAEDGQLSLYAFESANHASVSSSRVASFSREHVEAHRGSHGTPSDKIVCMSVPAKSFATLKNEHNLSTVDLLAIDTEGMDCKILSHVLDSSQPNMIYFEHAHVETHELASTLARLKQLDYIVFSLFADTVCLKASSFLPRSIASP